MDYELWGPNALEIFKKDATTLSLQGVDAKLAAHQGLGSLKMDLDRAEQETKILRA